MRSYRLLGIALGLWMLFCLSGCTVRGKESLGYLTPQEIADQVARRTTYIKDPNTGQCAGYYWGGGTYGGPAVWSIPCDSIPPHLLFTGNTQPLLPR